ncbi:MAG: ribonuclease PH [Longimicrobiales bacterium]
MRERPSSALRPLTFERGAAPDAEGSCLISAGRTRVLCTATVQAGVPAWRAAARAGWVTAEYAMLPRSTGRRTPRERGGAGGRTQEIQRLIGRSLRATVDLAALGDHTILIDCDVLRADGGTRTAAISGASIALYDACAWLVARGRVSASPFRTLVSAVSVGLIDGVPHLDLDYTEDVAADVDMNVVALEDDQLVEVQGTAEGVPFNRAELDRLLDLALAGIGELRQAQRQCLS